MKRYYIEFMILPSCYTRWLSRIPTLLDRLNFDWSVLIRLLIVHLIIVAHSKWNDPLLSDIKKTFLKKLDEWGSPVSRLQHHYKETVYFLPVSSQEVLVFNQLTSEGWHTELTLELLFQDFRSTMKRQFTFYH